jgi:RNA polymerase sigma-70 factor (ECF subfamily)
MVDIWSMKWLSNAFCRNKPANRLVSVGLMALEERNSATSLCVLDLSATSCLSAMAPRPVEPIEWSRSPAASYNPPSSPWRIWQILTDSEGACTTEDSPALWEAEPRFQPNTSPDHQNFTRSELAAGVSALPAPALARSTPLNPDGSSPIALVQPQDLPVTFPSGIGSFAAADDYVADSMVGAVDASVSVSNNNSEPETVSLKQPVVDQPVAPPPADTNEFRAGQIHFSGVGAEGNVAELSVPESGIQIHGELVDPVAVFGQEQPEPDSASFGVVSSENELAQLATPPSFSINVRMSDAHVSADTIFDSVPSESVASGQPMAAQRLADPSMTVSVVSAPRANVPDGQISTDGQQEQQSVSPIANGPAATPASVSGPMVFRLVRHAESGPELAISYSVTGFRGSQAVSASFQTTLPAGAKESQITIPSGAGGEEFELVMVSLGKASNCGIGNTTSIGSTAGKVEACSDTVLLTAFREGGSEEAFTILRNRHWNDVVNTCRKVLGNWTDAEDASQLVFFALSQAKISVPVILTRWLHRVASNAALDLARSRKRRKKHERVVARPVSVPGDEPSNQLEGRLEEALSLLPGPLQQAVRLKYVSGWSQKEAARLAGCPRGTLSRRAAQGIRLLRDLLNRDARFTS